MYLYANTIPRSFHNRGFVLVDVEELFRLLFFKLLVIHIGASRLSEKY